MPRRDYGQAPSIEPDFQNARVISQNFIKKHCENLKYIDNSFLNSDNRGYKGFSLVGRHKVTGKWRIIKVWGVW